MASAVLTVPRTLRTETFMEDSEEPLGNQITKNNYIDSCTLEDISKEHDNVLKTFRLLIADLCQQFNGGHPG